MGESADWGLTACAEPGQDGTFSADGLVGGGMVQDGQGLPGKGVGRAALDGKGALAGGGTHLFRLQPSCDDRLLAEALEAGPRQDQGVAVAFAPFAQARVHVATQRDDLQLRKAGQQLGAAAEAAGADSHGRGRGSQSQSGRGDPGVARVFPSRDSGKEERGGANGGNVFETVDSQVHFARGQGLVNFLGEQFLAANGGEGAIGETVTTSGEENDFGGKGAGAELRGNVLGLPTR